MKMFLSVQPGGRLEKGNESGREMDRLQIIVTKGGRY